MSKRSTQQISNKFELVALATYRAKELATGTPPVIHTDSKKEAVIALQEIEKDAINIEKLKESCLQRSRLHMLNKQLGANSTDEITKFFDALMQVDSETVKVDQLAITETQSEIKDKNTDRQNQLDQRYEDITA